MNRHLPTLGFDPTPGDVAASRAVAQTTGAAAEALHEIAAVLAGSAGGEWRGKAAIAFRDLLDDDFKPKVDKAAKAFDQAARVLHRWTVHMEDEQRRAAHLERRAHDAHEHARGARGRAAQVRVPDVVPEDPTSLSRHEDAVEQRRHYERQADDADRELAAARDDARRLQDAYEAAGQDAARQLKHAMDLAPDEPGFWDRLGSGILGALDKIGDAVADLGDWATDLLHTIAPVLELIGDLAALLSTACAILALVPVLTPLMAPAALALGGVALAGHYLSAVGETGSFLDALTDSEVLWDAAGLVTGGAVLKYGGRMTKAVYRAARANGNTYRVVRVASTGRRMHVPLKLFDAVRREGYAMSRREVLMRSVDLTVRGADEAVLAKNVLVDAVGGRLAPVPALITSTYGPFLHRTPALTR